MSVKRRPPSSARTPEVLLESVTESQTHGSAVCGRGCTLIRPKSPLLPSQLRGRVQKLLARDGGRGANAGVCALDVEESSVLNSVRVSVGIHIAGGAASSGSKEIRF